MKRQLLLLSNSTCHPQPYLDWCRSTIIDFLNQNNVDSFVFIPFAGVTINWDDYQEKVNQGLQGRINITGIHKVDNMVETISSAQAICIGGGNTFNLLNQLQTNNLISIIRKRVIEDGIPYIGWSAGTNVACPDIRTTNDMPIVWPTTAEALNLFPYNINPHYTELTIPNHGGETRMDRLNEAFAIDPRTIICLPEGTGIRVDNGSFTMFRSDLSPNHLPLSVKILSKSNSDKPEILEHSLHDKLTTDRVKLSHYD